MKIHPSKKKKEQASKRLKNEIEEWLKKGNGIDVLPSSDHFISRDKILYSSGHFSPKRGQHRRTKFKSEG